MYNPLQARDPLGKWVKEHGGASRFVRGGFPASCGRGGIAVLVSFLLGLYVSSDGVLADVSDASEVGRWRP